MRRADRYPGIIVARAAWLAALASFAAVAGLGAAPGTQNRIVKFDAAGNPTADSVLFENSSRLGLGSTNPRHLLRLFGGPAYTSSGWAGALELENAAAIAWGLPDTPAGNTGFGMGHTSGGFYMFETGAPGQATLPANYVFVIRPGGNVGLGTTSPTNRLSVTGNANVTGRLGIGIAAPTNPLSVAGNANITGRLGIGVGVPVNPLSVAGNADFTGSLGLGTTAPSERLEVRGNTKTRGNLFMESPGGARTVEIRGDFGSGQGGGWMTINDESAAERVTLAGRNGETGVGGLVHIKNGNGWPTIALIGDVGDSTGRIVTPVLEITGGSDLAEPFDVADRSAIEPGTVVVIDAEHPGQLRRAERAYDRAVAGIGRGANGERAGLTMQQIGSAAAGAVPVALSGRVYCWADAAHGPIVPGDLLTTSSTPGHAMRVGDPSRAPGAVLGKAMTPLSSGRGLVLVLVALQ